MVYVQIWTRQSNGNLSEAVVARLVNDRRHRREAARKKAVLEGYKVEVLSLESVVHLFKERGNQFALPRRTGLRTSESELGKQFAPT
jgi:hypothetical protein